MTLIEVLVSVGILAASAVVILQAFVRGAYTLALVKNRMAAYAFSSAKMADVELALRQGKAPEPKGRFRMGRDEFEWRIEAGPSGDDPQLARIALTVGWHQGRSLYESQVVTLARLPEAAAQ